MNAYSSRLALLRTSLAENSLDAYLIPSSDPNLGEYIPDHWRIIEWLTGFTGSAGTVVITKSFAGLWTDSRYFVQAENQLAGSGFVMIKSPSPEKKDYNNWIAENMAPGSRIGTDGRIFSLSRLRKLETITKDKQISIDTDTDLISALWTDRPPISGSAAFDHPLVFCGKDRKTKISELRHEMEQLHVDYHLLTSSDDIMWLLNIRGNDMKYSPLLSSFALVDPMQILFFADESKIPLKLALEFDKLGIVLLPYEETEGMLTTLDREATILITPGTTSASVFKSIPGGMKILEDISIPARMKAIKNNVEIGNISKVMVKDGVALTKFFYDIEMNYGNVHLTELLLAEKIDRLRSEQENFLGPSFSTIIAFNQHGALPHYSATTDSDSVIGSPGLLLADSGGQYLDGTTDITRTIVLGMPTIQQKRDFTLVLKGMIALAMAKFPEGTYGSQLDVLARKALWEQGLNFGHGTGHGVGFCLNVHEGPQSISPSQPVGQKTYIEPGMLISDEPAIYREREYGIRIENLILCYEDEVTEFSRFYKFDTVSLCYIDKTLIDIPLLDQKEKDWLNAYHSVVYEKISPLLLPEEKEWLKDKTSAL